MCTVRTRLLGLLYMADAAARARHPSRPAQRAVSRRARHTTRLCEKCREWRLTCLDFFKWLLQTHPFSMYCISHALSDSLLGHMFTATRTFAIRSLHSLVMWVCFEFARSRELRELVAINASCQLQRESNKLCHTMVASCDLWAPLVPQPPRWLRPSGSEQSPFVVGTLFYSRRSPIVHSLPISTSAKLLDTLIADVSTTRYVDQTSCSHGNCQLADYRAQPVQTTFLRWIEGREVFKRFGGAASLRLYIQTQITFFTVKKILENFECFKL